MKHLSLSLLIAFLIISCNLCMSLESFSGTSNNDPAKKEQGPVASKKSGVKKAARTTVDKENNIHWHSVRFIAKVLKRLGEKRPIGDLRDELVKSCPTQNIVTTLRTDVINCKVLATQDSTGSTYTKNLPIDCLKTMIQHVVAACPTVVQRSAAMILIQAAQTNLNPQRKTKLKKLQRKALRAVTRIETMMNLSKDEVNKKLSDVHKELKNEKAREKAKEDHLDVMKTLDKLGENVKKMRSTKKAAKPKNTTKSVDSKTTNEVKPKKKKKNSYKNKKGKSQQYYNEYLDDDEDFSVFPPAPSKDKSPKKASVKSTRSSAEKKKSSFIEIGNVKPKKKEKRSKVLNKEFVTRPSKKSPTTSTPKKAARTIENKSTSTQNAPAVPANTADSKKLIQKVKLNKNKNQTLSAYMSKVIKYFAEKF